MENFRAIFKRSSIRYLLLALFCLFLACLSNDYDYDLYARLIVGENFIDNHFISYQDFLSYTPTHLWYDHEWGASVIFYAFFKVFGAYGLIISQAITSFITALFVIKTQSIQNKKYPTTYILALILLLFITHLNPSLVRCHMFSFMFFAIYLYILEKTRLKNSNLIWLIPILTIIWNNIHGGVVSGLGMIFIYFIVAIVTRQQFKKYAFVLLLSTPLLAINPYGIEYLNFLISANTMERKYITEWWPVFRPRHVIYYYPAFCFGLVTTAVAIKNFLKNNKKDFVKLIAVILTTTLGFIHVKLLSLTVITATALYGKEILHIFDKIWIKRFEKLAIFTIVCSIFFIPFTKPLIPRVDINKFPVLETEFLKINSLKGNIVTSFGLSSYVAYKLYPNNKIYMDGRYEEVYNLEEFNTLINYELGEYNWENIFLNYPTDILMPLKTIPVYEKIKKHPDWKLIYEGNLCGIFIKKNRAKKLYAQPNLDIKYYQKTAFENFGKFGEAQ